MRRPGEKEKIEGKHVRFCGGTRLNLIGLSFRGFFRGGAKAGMTLDLIAVLIW